MKYRLFLTVVLIVLSLGVLFASDFWLQKSYTEWTENEVEKILNQSPWAKPVRISTSPMAPRAQGASIQGGAVPQPREINLTVRWESALPVKQAQAKRRFGAQAGEVQEALDYINRNETAYIVSVSGEGLLDRTQAGQDEVARRNAEETAKARMLGNTILKIKNRPEMTPDGVEVTVQQNYAIAIFTFSKEKPFQVSDKNVEFELDMGRFKIKKKFNLKDMVYQDRLEL
jgi:hypothetical protein